jgi:hypothetical protein
MAVCFLLVRTKRCLIEAATPFLCGRDSHIDLSGPRIECCCLSFILAPPCATSNRLGQHGRVFARMPKLKRMNH